MRSSRVLAWPAQAEQQEIVFRKDGVVERRQDRPLVAVNARERVLAPGEGAAEVGAELFLDAARDVSGLLELAEGLGPGLYGGHGALSPANCRRFESFNRV